MGARTQFVPQSEAFECGHACLCMVANHHRYEIDLATLRRRFPVSLGGVTLKYLMGFADSLGFNTRPLRVEIDALADVKLPAVIHWDLNHFVVLAEVKRTMKGVRYKILDPARTELWVERDELSRHFTGVVLELTPSERFKRKSEAVHLRITQLWSHIAGWRSALVQVLVLTALLQIFSLAAPFYLQTAIDSVLPSFDADLLLTLALGFGGLALFGVIASSLRDWILLSVGTTLGSQVVINLFRHMLRLPQSWFEKRHIGDVVSRFGSTQPVVDMLTQGVISALLDGLMAVTTVILMFIYCPPLAWLALAAFALYALIGISSLRAVRLLNSNVIAAQAREQSLFMESVRGIQAIKLFAREADRQRNWMNKYTEVLNTSLKLGRMNIGFGTAQSFIMALENVVFVYMAVRFAMKGDLTLGMIFAFQAYKGQFMGAALSLVQQAIEYKMLDIHMGRIADIALNPVERMNNENALDSVRIEGRIEFKDVSFKYAPHERDILKKVSFIVEPGETVAIAGPSGGGKTTLLKLILGLLTPTEGEVLIDGQSLERVNKHNYRRQLGVVMQEDSLFAGSIAENIAFFDPEISMDRVIDAAKNAHIHDDIVAMTMGYENLVGDMGSALSGGQKQRVLLARALYQQPRLLVLDEGTAHLDVATEALVSQVIRTLDITRIIVAHRPETIRSADRVLVLDRGTLNEDTPSFAVAAE